MAPGDNDSTYVELNPKLTTLPPGELFGITYVYDPYKDRRVWNGKSWEPYEEYMQRPREERRGIERGRKPTHKRTRKAILAKRKKDKANRKHK